ncbi:helix-turn-helix transcriptional regulator [Thermobifida halotolerans]|uniref:Helix-turn-helix transcriptional regulator n=1 Tax=Thermobifida halotolerans TaxID=483545 RepID=A0A399G6M6_9ACTN|nr:helix-turn-helix transcriptional regulator [Thermobifida halotolerans]UOE21512.1 helix-turn-helix transcriptional regulator [Thermobifida halotolerans]
MAVSDSPDRAEVLEWVERVSAFLAPDGVPPIAGRVLGWLMVCDPPEQSAAQIGEAIGASRASLTTNLRMLMTMGFVTRRTRPGQRTAHYRLDPGAWHTVVQRQVASIRSYLEVTEDGLNLVGPDSERAARIREAHEVFSWMARVFADAPPPPPPGRKR